MWIKFVLLLAYLVLVFLVSVLLDTALRYSGRSTFSRTVLDPVSLSVKKLKQLLDSRGVRYTGVGEKELTTLVEESGQTTNEELKEAEEAQISAKDLAARTTRFTCGSHFYEEVEDTKDSAWLVLVILPDGRALLDKYTWREVIARVMKFGVRAGIFECSRDLKLCERKGWIKPQLILALPRGNRAKEDVVLQSYFEPSKSPEIMQWLHSQLSARVHVISSPDEFQSNWLTYKEKSTEVRAVLISSLTESPLLLSTLSIKFTGRVKFGMIYTSDDNLLAYKSLLPLSVKKFPIYLIITPQKAMIYGTNPGEILNYPRMELYLKWFRPEVNDIFILSLILVNIMVGIELFLKNCTLWKHVIHWVYILVKYNILLFIGWLLLLGLYQFTFMQTISDFCILILQNVSATKLGVVLREYWMLIGSYYFISSVLWLYGIVVGYLWSKYRPSSYIDNSSLFTDWWSQPWESHLVHYFFRPVVSLTRPLATHEMDLEEGMERLIVRLSAPDLWLHPVVPHDYLNSLPVWQYRGWQSDNLSHHEKSDTGTCTSSCSEDETVPLILSGKSQNGFGNDQGFKSANDENSRFSQDETKGHNLDTSSADCCRFPEGMIKCRECSICLDSYKYKQVLCGLPCGHNFHEQCIKAWLERDNHCCPICRHPSYKPVAITHLHDS